MRDLHRIRLLCLSSSAVSVELVNEFICATPTRQRWLLNEREVLRSHDNVVTLRGLSPDTDYVLCAESTRRRATLRFRSPPRAAELDIRMQGADLRRPSTHMRALQATLDVCPNDGAVVVPRGTWISGPLYLHSRVQLVLASGAVLRASPDPGAWPVERASKAGADGYSIDSPSNWEGDAERVHPALLNIRDAHDIHVLGEGTLDGGGSFATWWRRRLPRLRARRPRMLHLLRARRVSVSGLLLRNSPSWTIHAVNCSALVFADLRIRSPVTSPNTDGINPESCTDVDIAGVRISTGDDCIALKSGRREPGRQKRPPTSNVRISNCVFERGHSGIAIGSEMSGGISKVLVSRCRFEDTDRGVRIKTRRGRGGVVENVSVRSVSMRRVGTPFTVNCYYSRDHGADAMFVRSHDALPLTGATPIIRNLNLRDVDCIGVEHAACIVWGLAERPVERLTIRGFRVRYAQRAKPGAPEMAHHAIPLLRAGMEFMNVRGLRLRDIDIRGCHGPRVSRTPSLGAAEAR